MQELLLLLEEQVPQRPRPRGRPLPRDRHRVLPLGRQVLPRLPLLRRRRVAGAAREVGQGRGDRDAVEVPAVALGRQRPAARRDPVPRAGGGFGPRALEGPGLAVRARAARALT